MNVAAELVPSVKMLSSERVKVLPVAPLMSCQVEPDSLCHWNAVPLFVVPVSRTVRALPLALVFTADAVTAANASIASVVILSVQLPPLESVTVSIARYFPEPNEVALKVPVAPVAGEPTFDHDPDPSAELFFWNCQE